MEVDVKIRVKKIRRVITIDNEITPVKISLDGIPESTKESVLNPAAELIGQALSGALHYVLDPFVRKNIVKNHELKIFAKEIDEKTAVILKEDRDDSKIGLALKAMEDSKYQLNSQEIRDMFSSLIAASVNRNINDNVEPSFSSILKDLSPKDAVLLKELSGDPHIPAVSIQLEDTNTNLYFTKYKHILLLKSNVYFDALSVSSLERLGLIEISVRSLSSTENKKRYSNFLQTPFYQSVLQELPSISGENFNANQVNLVKEHVGLTPLGDRLCSVILP